MSTLALQAAAGGQINLNGTNTASTFDLTVPAINSTLATLTGTETLTNKTLTSPTLVTPILGTPTSGTLTNCTGLPNAGLVNSRVTVGSTAIALGATSTTLAGLTSVASNTLTSAASTALTLQSAGTTAITIDTSQNVGIGTASPRNPSSLSRVLNIDGPNSGITVSASSNANTTILSQVNADGQLLVYGSGNLILGTTNTERMRIDSAGRIQVNGTTIVDSARISVNFTGADSIGIGIKHTNAAATMMNFWNSSNTSVGSITSSGTNIAYNTSSDYRLKENILPMTGALAKVALLKPVTYKWKVNGSDGEGFIAHELAEVCPNAVHGEKDAVDEDGNPKYQGIDVSFLVATLTAALQELKAINDTQAETINALTARIVALEAK